MPKMKMVKRGRGRPTVGKRMALGLRVTPELKQRLDAAAEDSGRSQSQEAEFRLERSFDRADLLAEVLTLAYGEEVASVLKRIGTAIKMRGMEMMQRNIREAIAGVHGQVKVRADPTFQKDALIRNIIDILKRNSSPISKEDIDAVVDLVFGEGAAQQEKSQPETSDRQSRRRGA